MNLEDDVKSAISGLDHGALLTLYQVLGEEARSVEGNVNRSRETLTRLREAEATQREDANIPEATRNQIIPASLETDLSLVEMGAYDDDLDTELPADRQPTADEQQSVFDHFIEVHERFSARRDFAREELVRRKLLPQPV